jgi:anti-sigma B factor antagonist
MEIGVEKMDGVTVVRLEGERATLQNAWEFRNALSELVDRGENRVVVDLSPVNFADSSFLGVLIHFFKILVRRDGELKVVGLNSNLRILFEMANLTRLFDIYETVDDALRETVNIPRQ